jgi:hypothetical protein
MDINFRVALAPLSRALTVVLFRAWVFVAGGFTVIIIFGMMLFVSRTAGGAGSAVAIVFAGLAILGWWVIGRVLRRFFLYRRQSVMLLLFSGYVPPASGLTAAVREVGRFFPDYSSWRIVNRRLRLALSAFYRGGKEFPMQPAVVSTGSISGIGDQLAIGSLSQAILALAFSRGSTDTRGSVREGLVLYFQHGVESRNQARQWLWLSAAGLAILFFCIALPNWFFFKSAGTPVWFGIVLAAVIARMLHQAFVLPFVLAGVCGSLLAETNGKIPDPGLCEKLGSIVPGI